MLRSCLIMFSLCSINMAIFAQTRIIPFITARVDTTDTDVKQIYKLYTNYLNAAPDSIYPNPYWNMAEKDANYIVKISHVDRAAETIFNSYNHDDFFRLYQPKILLIEKSEENRFMIKVLFDAHNSVEMQPHSPFGVIKLYASKNTLGEFKLENSRYEELKNWKVYKQDYITYFVPTTIPFHIERAKKTKAFCDSIANMFGIKEISPIKCYMTVGTESMWRLFNFDYYLYGGTGLAAMSKHEIYTAFGREDLLHEFVHVLLPRPKNPTGLNHNLITEGVATWLTGPTQSITFGEALHLVSIRFNKEMPQSLDDIFSYKYRNKFDNTIFYVTGAVICKLVYEKAGLNGFWEIYNCPNDLEKLKNELSKVLKKPYPKIEKDIIKYISEIN